MDWYGCALGWGYCVNKEREHGTDGNWEHPFVPSNDAAADFGWCCLVKGISFSQSLIASGTWFNPKENLSGNK